MYKIKKLTASSGTSAAVTHRAQSEVKGEIRPTNQVAHTKRLSARLNTEQDQVRPHSTATHQSHGLMVKRKSSICQLISN